MRKSLNTVVVRKRAGIAAAGLAVAAAITVPGVAWANDAIPQGPAVAVGESAPAVLGAPLDEATCAAAAIELSPETLQKMIEAGTAVPATPTVPATEAVEAAPAEIQVPIPAEAEGMAAPTVIRIPGPADLPAELAQVLTIQMDENAPAGAVTVARAC
ncbi:MULTISPECIES: hypothetical protein [unclassified Rhodococcus (in: high G+C Gram-positive bacteria)]|jgi:hypothetical protein|uniref:hypothetical protein n=1 Tax=unclassified Rhodococcus (in: high G+C Gram-positive bacteria) TaxID=192944 RepID=UPI000BD2F2CF|nr:MULTISPECIES: hypothetical protein [unclassified Rhodococcus (in: high G+C Gram-positive bacteria)]MBP1160255.1 hypothetical protein [Rhodococcus sp. PvR099]PTR42851.1 hypothetical protein C8K38_110150 [Rhodococcus sp. OK611]SNX91792.1 hypothetical protein SAMN05447004_11177 [Rhodococcus sp. OK270]